MCKLQKNEDTHVMQPVELPPLRVRLDMTLEVHILPILDVLGR